MDMPQQDILKLVRNGLADLRGDKQEQRETKATDYATGVAEQDTNARDAFDFFVSAWLTGEHRTTDTQDVAPPTPPQPDLPVPTMPPPGIMLQINLINAINHYRSRSEYYAARQIRNLGHSMLGQDAFNRALEMAGVENLPRQTKQMSGNLMALEALVLVWEEMVCLGSPDHAAFVKGITEELHGQDVLKDKKKKWRGGAEVYV
ncbi:hypothetical protein AC579_2592 [Pseudocercospora musae]|uniref:Uncharacterized protein n=1 Tax=Pseudocercospora musae TaxID=113226 RepID=A0A139IEU7_9PEZI|nr:hypothetical protein AC579_2592 [Pseudocercospora musae]